MYISFPSLNPIIFSIGPFSAHWYGLMYVISFVFAIWRNKKNKIYNYFPLKKKEIEKLLYITFLGACLGGRIGYIIFYNFIYFYKNIFLLFKIWKGGMSFHGGLIGSMIAIFWFSRKYKISILKLSDTIAPLVPFGLGAGRLGNFINGELWGRFAPNIPYAMIFPSARNEDLKIIHINPKWIELFQKYHGLPRHPSQIYEMFLEGIVLFFIMYFFTKKKRPIGSTSGLFLISYGIIRIYIECFREPDAQIGLFKQCITMGQILSIPMVIIGLIIIIKSYHKKYMVLKNETVH